MNVIAFPGTPPTGQQVLETVYKYKAQRPAWQLEVMYSEAGQPFIEANHSLAKTVLGFHWKPGSWAVTNSNARVLAEGPSLDELMAAHLR